MKATIDTQEYYPFLQQIKEKIITARHQAVLAVNSRMIFLYWEIGMYILAQQRVKGWGAKVIDQLSADLKKDFPDMKGLSPRNLKYMRKFADELSPRLIVQQLAALNVIKQASKTYTINHNLFVQHPAALLPWSQNMVLMEKVKSPDEYLFYALKSIENGWSRNVLVHQIEKELHKQQCKITSNFRKTLPAPVSELANDTFKDTYFFDFIHIREQDQVKGNNDQPSIGLILCKKANRIIAEYAIRDITKPMGVAQYKLMKRVPKNFKELLPAKLDLEKTLKTINEK